MKLKSKDSEKFLGVDNRKICLKKSGYELKKIKKDLNSNFFYLVFLEELKKSKKENPFCITPLTLDDGSSLILKEINYNDESQLWKFDNGYFINKKEKEGKNMCIDVCCENKEENTDILIYHIKNKSAKNPNNQLWEIQ